MPLLRLLRLLLCFSLLAAPGFAASEKAAVDLDFAFDQLKANGPGPFARALFRSQRDEQSLTAQLEPLVREAGIFLDFEVLSDRPISRRVNRVIVVLHYETKPLYFRFDRYKGSFETLPQAPRLSDDAKDILPHDILAQVGP